VINKKKKLHEILKNNIDIQNELFKKLIKILLSFKILKKLYLNFFKLKNLKKKKLFNNK
jgi:hypothetical protein